MQPHGLRAAIPHLVAVGSLTFLLVVITAAVAEDIKIMGLTENNPASVDSNSSRTYYTGSCQKKQGPWPATCIISPSKKSTRRPWQPRHTR